MHSSSLAGSLFFRFPESTPEVACRASGMMRRVLLLHPFLVLSSILRVLMSRSCSNVLDRIRQSRSMLLSGSRYWKRIIVSCNIVIDFHGRGLSLGLLTAILVDYTRLLPYCLAQDCSKAITRCGIIGVRSMMVMNRLGATIR